MNPGDLCLVTGVSGYLASWIAKDLLARGFRVRGTVRSLADTDRTATLARLLPGIELVAADLRQEDGWTQAVAGCAWVFHVASPQAVKAERQRTAGALSGTRHLLSAAFAEPSVRKVVVTSSEAAIAYGHPRSQRSVSEDDWTDLSQVGAGADYFRSKTLAERLAWELAADARVNPRKVPLATVNPCLILGPSLVPWGRFSLQLLSDIATGKMPLLVDMTVHMVDVRDCARMHVAVMADASTDGRRQFSFATQASFADLTRSVARQFGPLGFRPRARVAPQWLAWLLSKLSPAMRSIYSHVGNPIRYEAKNPGVYRYEHRDADAIVKASFESILAHRWLAAKTSTRAVRHPGR